MHSPILAAGTGLPAAVCQFKKQSHQGFLGKKTGLGEWLFDLDEADD